MLYIVEKDVKWFVFRRSKRMQEMNENSRMIIHSSENKGNKK